jgi:hypothetical protein
MDLNLLETLLLIWLLSSSAISIFAGAGFYIGNNNNKAKKNELSTSEE